MTPRKRGLFKQEGRGSGCKGVFLPYSNPSKSFSFPRSLNRSARTRFLGPRHGANRANEDNRKLRGLNTAGVPSPSLGCVPNLRVGNRDLRPCLSRYATRRDLLANVRDDILFHVRNRGARVYRQAGFQLRGAQASCEKSEPAVPLNAICRQTGNSGLPGPMTGPPFRRSEIFGHTFPSPWCRRPGLAACGGGVAR
jgi:hypothetical protein